VYFGAASGTGSGDAGDDDVSTVGAARDCCVGLGDESLEELDDDPEDELELLELLLLLSESDELDEVPSRGDAAGDCFTAVFFIGFFLSTCRRTTGGAESSLEDSSDEELLLEELLLEGLGPVGSGTARIFGVFFGGGRSICSSSLNPRSIPPSEAEDDSEEEELSTGRCLRRGCGALLYFAPIFMARTVVQKLLRLRMSMHCCKSDNEILYCGIPVFRVISVTYSSMSFGSASAAFTHSKTGPDIITLDICLKITTIEKKDSSQLSSLTITRLPLLLT
jgi:hypothetical protein